MGERKTHLQNLIAKYPKCIFCGGGTESVDEDHVPARTLFYRRFWPEGYAFAACRTCNNGSSDDDFLVGFIAKVCWDHIGMVDEAKEINVMEELRVKKPYLFSQLKQYTRSEQQEFLSKTPYSNIYQHNSYSHGLTHIPHAFNQALNRFAIKLAKALHFKHTGIIVSNETSIKFLVQSNANWMSFGDLLEYPAFQAFKDPGKLKREKIDISPQFNYTLMISEEMDASAFACRFGQAFSCILLVGMPD